MGSCLPFMNFHTYKIKKSLQRGRLILELSFIKAPKLSLATCCFCSFLYIPVIILQRKAKAKDIFMKHISVKASDPINIEYPTRQDVEKQLDSPNTSMFDVPQQEV